MSKVLDRIVTTNLIPICLIVGGFIAQWATIKNQTATIMTSVDKLASNVRELTSDVQEIREQQARFEEWKASQGSVPSSREFDSLIRDIEKVQGRIESLEEVRDRIGKVEAADEGRDSRLYSIELSLTQHGTRLTTCEHYLNLRGNTNKENKE